MPVKIPLKERFILSKRICVKLIDFVGQCLASYVICSIHKWPVQDVQFIQQVLYFQNKFAMHAWYMKITFFCTQTRTYCYVLVILKTLKISVRRLQIK